MNDMINAVLFKEPKAPPSTPPLLLFFEEKAVKDEHASKNGPPVFVPVHQVRVVVAGAKAGEGPIYELARKLPDDTWKVDAYAYGRFGKPYEDWKTGKASSDIGTPLEQWPLMDVAMVAAFKAANVYSVQQLAGLSDAMLDNAIRRGGREWRAKALAWLDEAKTAAGDVEARAENARLRSELEELKKAIADMQKGANKQALGFDKPKRGRQTREEDADDVTVSVVEEAGANRL